MGKGGIPLEVAGNTLCWINQWEFIRQGQGAKSTNKLLWHWNDKKVAWSSRILGREVHSEVTGTFRSLLPTRPF